MWEFINQSGLVLQMGQKSKRRKNRIYIFITFWTVVVLNGGFDIFEAGGAGSGARKLERKLN